MSVSDLLSQDEIDALLHGVDSGAVNTEPEPLPGEARQYDLSSQDRIIRGRMPTLEMVNERFARLWRCWTWICPGWMALRWRRNCVGSGTHSHCWR